MSSPLISPQNKRENITESVKLTFEIQLLKKNIQISMYNMHYKQLFTLLPLSAFGSNFFFLYRWTFGKQVFRAAWGLISSALNSSSIKEKFSFIILVKFRSGISYFELSFSSWPWMFVWQQSFIIDRLDFWSEENSKALWVYYSADATIKGSTVKKDHKEQIYFWNGH